MAKKNYIKTDGNGNIILQDVKGQNININDISAIKKAFETAEPAYLIELFELIDEKNSKLLSANVEQKEILNKILKILIKIFSSKLTPSQKEDINQQIYLNLDRRSIIDELKNLFEEFNNRNINKPQIIFLPGFLEDKHNLAVKKMKNKIYDKFDSYPLIHLRLEPWKNENNINAQINLTKRYIKESLDEYLTEKKHEKNNFPEPFVSGEFLAKLPFVNKHIFILEQDIYLSNDNKNTFDAVKLYLNDFWNFEMDEDAKPIFIFLNIVYSPEKTKRKFLSLFRSKKKHNKELLNDFFDLLEDKENFINQFPELSKINRKHLERFFDDLEIYDEENFISEGETLRMKQVTVRLNPILAKRNIKKDNEKIADL